MEESEKLIQQVRERLRVERELVAKLDVTLKHEPMKQLLKRAYNSLDDVETIFLRSAELEQRGPVALQQWLRNTDLVFQIAAQQRKVVEDALATYGPDAVAI